MFANRSCKKRVWVGCIFEIGTLPWFQTTPTAMFRFSARPLRPFYFIVFFLPLVASLSEGEHCRVSTRSDENVTAWFMPHLDPLFLSAGRSRQFLPPHGRRPYPASAEGKVPCKGSKLFFPRAAPNWSEHSGAVVFLTPPRPTFRENGRILFPHLLIDDLFTSLPEVELFALLCLSRPGWIILEFLSASQPLQIRQI